MQMHMLLSDYLYIPNLIRFKNRPKFLPFCSKMQFRLRIARFFFYRFRQTEAFRNLSLIPAAHRDTLQFNNLQIVRHEYASLEIDCGFC